MKAASAIWTAIKTVWAIFNVASITAAALAKEATGSDRIAKLVRLAGWLDWGTPGPVVSGTFIAIFTGIILIHAVREVIRPVEFC